MPVIQFPWLNVYPSDILSLPFLPPNIKMDLVSELAIHPNLDLWLFILLIYSQTKVFKSSFRIELFSGSKPPTIYTHFFSFRKLVIFDRNELNKDYFCYTIDKSQHLLFNYCLSFTLFFILAFFFS